MSAITEGGEGTLKCLCPNTHVPKPYKLYTLRYMSIAQQQNIRLTNRFFRLHSSKRRRKSMTDRGYRRRVLPCIATADYHILETSCLMDRRF